MLPLMHVEQADAVDLLDGVCSRLEQAQSIAMTLADQLERIETDSQLRGQMAGAISTVHQQISEAQSLAEMLTRRLPTDTLEPQVVVVRQH